MRRFRLLCVQKLPQIPKAVQKKRRKKKKKKETDSDGRPCNPDLQEKKSCIKCMGSGFIDEIDITKSLAAYDLYPEFKRWFWETYPNKRKDQMPDKKKFTTIMSGKDKLKEQHKRRWWGVALRKVNHLEE